MSSSHIIYRKDYQKPDYLVDSIHLVFKLYDAFTLVENTMVIRSNYDRSQRKRPLVLNGVQSVIALQQIICDGKILSESEWETSENTLVIKEVPETFTLTIINKIEPHKNKALQGLYRSNQLYCTQCEPHGFSRITYAIDRPDVPSRFTTRIEADKAQFPYLLTNGNLVEQGDLAETGRHWVVWEDPFKKPTYLFALVAGNLARIEDTFTTRSGRKILLHIFVEEKNRDQCHHAMMSLKQAMQWDEEVFGLEYDLDIYMIVAVSEFNMGAMENKGLNIFNDKYILAKESVATDLDFLNIQRVVGHEYFHNWSGNRVTVRDWFELSLKEGLTVYREQEFIADMTSAGVRRIESAQLMCTTQFAEDASKLAHPIRPDAYREINNFYTVTVYDKGAEVIRMLAHLLGKKGFHLGMTHYFERFDGEAVTCDEFVDAQERTNELNLEQFRRWYSQVGTPELQVSWRYEEKLSHFILTIEQTPSTVLGFEDKQCLSLPIIFSLLDPAGKLIPLSHEDNMQTEIVLHIHQPRHEFTFAHIASLPTPSLLRGFSAPVKLITQYTKEDLLFLLKYDTDAFCVWNTAQQLFMGQVIRLDSLLKEGSPLTTDETFLSALQQVLNNEAQEEAVRAKIIQLVTISYVMEFLPQLDVARIVTVMRFLRLSIAQYLEADLHRIYQKLNKMEGEYQLDPKSIGRRALKNTCLVYLAYLNKPEYRILAMEQYENANNMTDMFAALEALNDVPSKERQELLEDFIQQWSEEPLVVNKWLALQARADLNTAFEKVLELTQTDYFDIHTPNKVYALFLSFIKSNWASFHDNAGEAYEYIVDRILEIDTFNPNVAAALTKPFTEWQRFAPAYQTRMKAALERLMLSKTLSSNVQEMVEKSLV